MIHKQFIEVIDYNDKLLCDTFICVLPDDNLTDIVKIYKRNKYLGNAKILDRQDLKEITNYISYLDTGLSKEVYKEYLKSKYGNNKLYVYLFQWSRRIKT